MRGIALVVLAALLGGAGGALIVERLHAARFERIEHDIRDIDKADGQTARWFGRLSGNFDLLREALRNAGVVTLTRNPDPELEPATGDRYTVEPRRCACGAP